jgi:hypothetical protein
MKPLLLILFTLLLAGAGMAQQKRIPYQISAGFSAHGTISGDTTYFKYQNSRGDLQLYFNRNIRVPSSKYDYPELETGTCTLHFLIDTLGAVIQSWCEHITNEMVAKEALRVIQKIGKLTPTKIGGKPVRTEVTASVGFYYAEDTTYKSGKDDIIIIAYPPRHKKVAGVR